MEYILRDTVFKTDGKLCRFCASVNSEMELTLMKYNAYVCSLPAF